jgi:NTE family protein
MAAHRRSGDVALVLAGGGARGAYEVGALSELLPRLPPEEQPSIIVGTSVGAINAAYLAATAERPVAEALEQGCDIWRGMRWETALSPLVSFAQLRLVLRSLADALGLPGGRAYSLLDPSPLTRTLGDLVPFERVHANVTQGLVRAAAVVVTRASSSLSVVFCDTAGELPATDARRGIAYRRTERLDVDHVLASAAIPGAFPAVAVAGDDGRSDWYYDGGTRLNTPIRPALDLGAKRVIVIGLHPPRIVEGATGETARPQVLDGVAQLLQGVLVDPLVNDLHTLTLLNQQAAAAPGESLRVVPYILIAPEEQFEIGELAARTFARRYGRRRPRDGSRSVARLGRFLDVRDSRLRGELLSYLFFDPEFAEELIDLGRRHARRWLDRSHDLGPWRTGPLVANP